MLNEFWAGYLSGAVSIVVGNPLDLIKVRLQGSAPGTTAATNPRNWKSHKTLVTGLPAPILTYGALNALLFTVYSHALAHLPQKQSLGGAEEESGRRHTLVDHFIAGNIAGFATFFISTPTEYLKCRAQLAEQVVGPKLGRDASSLGIAMDTLRDRGIRGLFLGGTVTSVRDAVGYGFWFATYEGSKELWTRFDTRNNREPGRSIGDTFQSLVCGGLAGVATWTSVFPLDVIKTRVQTQSLSSIMHMHNERPPAHQLPSQGEGKQRLRSAIVIAQEAYRHEGLKVFWRGLGVCCLRAFVVNAVQWTVYEWAIHRSAFSGTTVLTQ